MPQVPRRRDTELQTVPLPGQRQTRTPSLGAFGGGEATSRAFEAGRDLVNTGIRLEAGRQKEVAAQNEEAEKAFQESMKQEREFANEVMIRDVDLDLSKAETMISMEARKLQGRDAAKAPDFVAMEWARASENAVKQATNDEQRLMIEKIAAQRAQSLNRVAQSHMSEALKKHDDEMSAQYLKAQDEQASVNSTDQDMVDRAHAIKKFEIEKMGKRLGMGDDWIKLETARQRSKTHAAVLERMIVDGNDEAAKAYDEKHNKEIQQDELNMLAKIRKTSKESKAEAKENLMRTLFLGTFSDDKRPPNIPKVGLDDAQTLLAQGVIDVGDYKLLEAKITNINDDKAIPAEDRMAAQLEVIEAFEELGGKVKGSKPTGELKAEKTFGRDLTREQIQGFRNMLIEKTRYLPETFQEEFLKNTNKAAIANEPEKMAVWSALASSLQDIGVPPAIRARTMKDALSIFEKDILFNKAEEKLFNLKEKAVREMNPNRSKYYLEQILTIRGIPVKVVGFDADGEPMIMQFPEASKKGKK